MNLLDHVPAIALTLAQSSSRFWKSEWRFRAVWSNGFAIVRLISLCVLLWSAIAYPVWAAETGQIQRTPLTLTLLQERLKSPTQSDGTRIIDLRRTLIDLRSDNQEFRTQFYRLIQAQMQRSPVPVGLDLSYSQIQGDIQLNELGFKTSLYGQTPLPNLTEAEQDQLQRDRRRLSQLSQLSRSLLIQTQTTAPQLAVLRGPLTLVQTRFEGFVNLTNTFLLGRFDAQGAIFTQDVDWSESRFSQPVNLVGAIFRRDVRFRNAIYFNRARFSQTQFAGILTAQGSDFRSSANFGQAMFQQTANFSRTRWQEDADFAQTRWQAQGLYDRSTFFSALFLTEAVFETSISFRQAQFNQPVNLRGASILDQADFGDVGFGAAAYLNVPGLQFNAEKAKILGNPGQIGRKLSLPILQGNETLLRNLVRNFRLLEQIPDANQIEYLTERLRLQALQQRIVGTNLNTATALRLQQVGFSQIQAEAIVTARQQRSFRSIADLLKVESVNLATYIKLRDRLVVVEPRGLTGRLGELFYWLWLTVLLALSQYGTNFWLVFGVGVLALVYFGLVFWVVDRLRRFTPQPVLPKPGEIAWMFGGSTVLAVVGFSATLQNSAHPWVTLGCLGLATLPIPGIILALLYRQGRYHDLMDVSYFVEDGSLRQLRLLIGRLPNIPNFPFFRDRYTPILWDRRWSWLNYLDFSLNNLMKIGFNDIRVRDVHVPGLINTLAWYQWGLGMLYLALLLWTLSRTIPGLNLLIYFK